jgi:uncharacterized damage-inducible protein DinB
MKPLLVLVAIPFLAQAQNPLSAELRTAYTIIKNNLLKMAVRMPEEHYGFKPTADLQTFQQRVAHIADANVRTCSSLNGVRKTLNAASKTKKEELVSALKESFNSCDQAFEAITDATAPQMVPGEIGSPVMPAGTTRTRLSTLWNVVRHSNEMYGYMSVYLRLKGIVPPSTAPQD